MKKVRASRGILVYKTYSFREKDPIIDELRTMLQDEGLSYHEIHMRGGPTEITLYNWFKGATRSPKTDSASAAAGAMGYTRKWVKRKT